MTVKSLIVQALGLSDDDESGSKACMIIPGSAISNGR
jgi:hypothetical protein